MKDSATYVATLRNMWVCVSLFNPLLGFLAMAVMPLSCAQVAGCDPNLDPSLASGDFIYKYQANLLGPVAGIVGGPALKAFICVDGVLVLAGSVLTSYVGIMGLVRRMALDRCLPSVLLRVNQARGTPHWIIMCFFGVASSLLLLLRGDVDMLSSVYNIAFLSVMTAFAVSCVILKWKRPDLPRLVVTSPGALLAALVCVLAGLAGNILRAPIVLAWFFVYFGVAAAIVLAMFNRTLLLRVALVLARAALLTREEAAAARERTAFLIERYDDHERARGTASGDSGAAAARSASPRASPAAAARPALSLQGAPEEGGEAASGSGVCEERGLRLVREQRGVGAGSSNEDDASSGGGCRGALLRAIQRSLDAVNGQPHVFFAKDGDLELLNKAIQYVRGNEQTARLVVVHVVDDVDAAAALQGAGGGGDWADAVAAGRAEEVLERCLPPLPESARQFAANVALLDAVYPKLRVDSLIVRGTAFGPLAIRWVGTHLGVGTNFMFMAMPDAYFPHRFAALGGLRVITRAAGAEAREARSRHMRGVVAVLLGVRGGGGAAEGPRGLLPA